MFARSSTAVNPFTYRRRQPEKTVLCQAIRNTGPNFSRGLKRPACRNASTPRWRSRLTSTLSPPTAWGRSSPVRKSRFFRTLRPPTRAEVDALSWTVCERTVDLLRRQGKWLDDANGEGTQDTLADKEPLLSSLAQASIRGTLLFGANAGKRVVRFFGTAARHSRDNDRADGDHNGAYGFNLHAGSRAAASDKTRREMMCRYLLRPPLSNERLTRLSDGRYEVRLKSPWKDGTTSVVLEGTELVGRLWCSFLRPAFTRFDTLACSRHARAFAHTWCGQKPTQTIPIPALLTR